MELAQRLQQAGVVATPAYVGMVLAMSDSQFAWWFATRIQAMSSQTVPEWSVLMQGNTSDRQGSCRLGSSIIREDLRLLLWLFEERTVKFGAIEGE